MVFMLHFIGVGLLLLSGWLGMVYRLHLGMVLDDSELERVEYQHHESLRLRRTGKRTFTRRGSRLRQSQAAAAQEEG